MIMTSVNKFIVETHRTCDRSVQMKDICFPSAPCYPGDRMKAAIPFQGAYLLNKGRAFVFVAGVSILFGLGAQFAYSMEVDLRYWSASCQESLAKGITPVVSWGGDGRVRSALAKYHRVMKARRALRQVIFGLAPVPEWSLPEFQALPEEEKQKDYFERWLLAFRGREADEFVTHHVIMDSGAIFERIVFDRNTQANPVGIVGPGFGSFGVSWRALERVYSEKEAKPQSSSLIWSAPADGKYTWVSANFICLVKGGRLPSIYEWSALSRALGLEFEDRRADIFGFGGPELFWSSTPSREMTGAYYMQEGWYGTRNLQSALGDALHRVICVR